MTTGRKARENLLHIMVQTPQDIFVYWDIQPDYLEMARLLLQGAQPGMVLRVFRESKGRTDETASIHLYPGNYSNSMYFHNQNPYATYYAELAFYATMDILHYYGPTGSSPRRRYRPWTRGSL